MTKKLTPEVILPLLGANRVKTYFLPNQDVALSVEMVEHLVN